MSYRVIKTVKGKQYAYLQESYRVGDKVKTRSKYLGAVSSLGSSGASGSPSNTETSHADHQSKEETHVINPKVITTKKDGLRIKGKFDSSSVSVSALQSKRSAFVKRMMSKGINGRALPQITLRASRRENTGGYSFNARSRNITVTMSKGGNRSDFRRNVFRAFGKSSLEAIKMQKPEQYKKLSLQFKQSHKASQKAISNYLKQTKGNTYKVYGLKFWGNAGNLKGEIEASKIGLVDYSKRKTWEDEALTIYSEMERVGISKFKQKHDEEYRQAQKELKLATTMRQKRSKWGKRRESDKKRLERAKARMEAHNQMRKKAKLVEKTFF